MSIPLNVNGSITQYPQTGDVDWGNQATVWAQNVTAGLPPKNGGTWILTGNLDLGSIAGLSATYFASNNSPNIATGGFLRMGNADSLTWLSTNETDIYSLTVDSTNALRFYTNATPLRVAFTDAKQSFAKAQAVTFVDVASSSGTLSIDVSASNNFKVNLTENITTINLANVTDGEHIFVSFKQGASAFTITWPNNFIFVGTQTGTPAITTVNGKLSVLTGVFNAETGFWICSLASQV
jgi:hypothetical protein